jgi:diaminopimelate epimerase
VEQLNDNVFRVRTYERGVEDETLSCGTGVTAVAIAMHYLGKTKNNVVDLKVEGGKLQVQFEEQNGQYSAVFLVGPAGVVFEGTIDL